MSKSGIKIINQREIERLFKKLDVGHSETGKAIKRVIRKPFGKMRKLAKSNLTNIDTGSLKLGLTTGSSSNKRRATFHVVFGARIKKKKAMIKVSTFARSRKRSAIRGKMNHLHFINSGTKSRRTKSGANRGKVTGTGFADRAIKTVLPSIKNDYIKGFQRVYNDIIQKNNT